MQLDSAIAADGGIVRSDASSTPDAWSAPDADLPADASDCHLEPGFTQGIRCATDGTATVTLLGTSHGGCCASATASPQITINGTNVSVDLQFEACSCCAGCPCLSQPMDLDVSLGNLAAGTYTVSTNAGSCTLTIGPAPMCNVADATETRMPRFLYADQPFAATILSTSALECGCRPEVPAISPTQRTLRLELCSCCVACDCIASPSYEASTVGPTLPIGTTSLSIPHGAADVTVVARGGTHDVPVTGLRVVGPDSSYVQSGPALWWVDVSGTDALCCATPMPLVDHSFGTDAIMLDVQSAAIDPCDCAGRPMPFDAWHSLGELAPGTYTISAGTTTTTFTVP
jgi:hypothetical protein